MPFDHIRVAETQPVGSRFHTFNGLEVFSELEVCIGSVSGKTESTGPPHCLNFQKRNDMIRAWKRFAQNLINQPNRRRMGAPVRQPAAIETLEERTVLSISTLAVDSDTHIMSHPYPEANLGGADIVRLFNGVGAVDRMLFQADLSSLTASGSKITSAVLELYQAGGFGENSMSLSIYAVAQQWTEGTQTFASGTVDGASWNQAQPGVDWTPGGELGGLVHVATLPTFVAAGWVQFDITATVRAWQDGLLANNGLAFVISSGGEFTEHRFTSSESSNTSLRPKLTVTTVDDPICQQRSPVATFILSHVHGDADWSNQRGRVIREVAHQLRNIEHDHCRNPTGNAHNSHGHASDHNPNLGAALPSGLGKLKRALG